MNLLGRGLVAGAAGTAALNAVTHADMAWRGRPASDVAQDGAEALADAVGLDVPGGGLQRSNRLTGLGALLGTATGLVVGVGAAGVRAAGVRLPAALEAVVTGAAAMAATNVPVTLLGVDDPRERSAPDWAADVVPHLAYGWTASAALRALDAGGPAPRPARAGLVVRAGLLGVAAGARSTLGLAAPALAARPTADRPAGGTSAGVRTGAVLAVIGELVGDKLPSTPSRTDPPGVAGRVVGAVGGAAALARREHANAALPVLAGFAGAVLGTHGGAAWRRWAAGRLPAVAAALVEDAVALALAAAATRAPRGSGPRA